MAHIPELSEEVPLYAKKSSLRYSLDSELEKSDTLSLSTDGPEIQFTFEQEEGSSFIYENVPPVEMTKERRRNMFAKYKKQQQQPIEVQKNDFMKSFDEIFDLQEKDKVPKNIPKQAASSNKDDQLTKKKTDYNTEESSGKKQKQQQIEQTKQNAEYMQKKPKQSIETQVSEHQPIPFAQQHIAKPVTPKKASVKVSFNYSNPKAQSQAKQKRPQTIAREERQKQYEKQEEEQADQLQIMEQKKQLDSTGVMEHCVEGKQNKDKIDHPFFEEQERISPFLRKIHKLNSIFPNFLHPLLNLETQKQYLQILANEMEKVITFVEKVADQVFFKLKVPKMFHNQFMRVDYFLRSGWEKKHEVNQIDQIKPKANVKRGQINEEKLFEALKNYKEVASYYKNYIPKDLDKVEGQKNYIRVRQKFWKLEKNIRSISEDVYRASLFLGYPRFFYEYLSVLKSPHPTYKDKRLAEKHKNILATLINNIQKKDPLSCSDVGAAVRTKIQRQLKFLHPF